MSLPLVFMVAEKPSICTSVAEALHAIAARDGIRNEKLISRNRSPPVYDFQGNFRGKLSLIRVTSVTGHLYSLDFPPKYQSWETTDPLDLFTAPTVHVSEKGGVVKHLEREAKNAEALVLWMDCDREGENICFEVIRSVVNSMKKGTRGPNCFRAKFSAVTQKDIERAMQNLVSPNHNEALSVDARQELDLKVGVAFSRFQTKYFQGKYGNLDSSIISYGPCQTPTLGFCVQRHDEIQSFTSEPFWSLDIALEVMINGNIKKVPVNWSRGRLFDQNIVETFGYMVHNPQNQSGISSTSASTPNALLCYDIKVSETRKTRPQPLNTVELLKLASKYLGIGPQAAMRSAEYLYLSGFLSYPRTESTTYPKSFDIREALEIQANNPEYSKYATNLLRHGYTQPRQGHDAGDHPPITPVGVPVNLSGDDWKIYDLVTCHFLATISKDATFLKTKAKFRSTTCNEEFQLIGKRELDPGYLTVYGGSKRQEDDEEDEDGDLEAMGDIPEFHRDQIYPIATMNIRQGHTTAPGYLTESELIGMMEKHGIGTDASIPTHINNILTRNYVSLGTGRTLIPTELGIVLVHGYLRIDPDLVLPEVRAAIETFCDLIAKGTASKDQVVKQSLTNFMKKFEYFRQHIGNMDSLFEASFSPLAATGKPLSKCGKCRRYLKFIPLKPQRLYCPTCEETYALPQNGTIKLYKELKCPLDNFDLLVYSLGNTEKAQGKSFTLCPYCYNYPPSFEDVEEIGKDTKGEGETKQCLDPITEGSKKDGEEEEEDDDEGEEDEEDEALKGLAHMGCNSCLHPSCKHSSIQNGVCDCPNEDCSGLMVLDVNSKPNWKLACNVCNMLIRFRAEIHNIIPEVRKECSECEERLITVEFNKLKSPLPDGQTTYTGCIVCDDFLSNLTEIVAGRTINITVLRQMKARRMAAMKGRKGRKGGRGGGRGRGKRRNKADILMSFEDF